MFKIFIAFAAGVAVAEAVRRVEWPHELRYLGWSGPHHTGDDSYKRDEYEDPEDYRSPGSKGP